VKTSTRILRDFLVRIYCFFDQSKCFFQPKKFILIFLRGFTVVFSAKKINFFLILFILVVFLMFLAQLLAAYKKKLFFWKSLCFCWKNNGKSLPKKPPNRNGPYPWNKKCPNINRMSASHLCFFEQ
jgi:hypothetical protein